MSENNENKCEEEVVSFEKKVEEAQALLEKLVDPKITLSQSVSVYKEGMEKLQAAQKLLDEAKLQFEELSQTQR
jgi:exodeoxyribonuclease VII small subunit